MRKNFFCLSLCAVLFALCLSAEAQQPKKIPRIGYLSIRAVQLVSPSVHEPIRAGSARAWLHRRTRTSPSSTDMRRGRAIGLPGLAAELVRLKVDMIVVAAGDATIQAAKNATKTIPIVMTGQGSDPVRAGRTRKPCSSRRQRHRPHKP